MFGGTALVLAKLLHQIKLLLSYDRLMSILKEEPFFLRISHGLLVFVGLLMCSEVDGVPAILRLVEDYRYCFTVSAFKIGVFVYGIPAL